jgi:hypothetical protein
VTPAPSPTTPPATSACRYAVGAQESEWQVRLSRTSVCAGTVTIEAQNWGDDPHDLWLVREDGAGEAVTWPELAPGRPGGVMSRRATLAPGRYRLLCTLVGGQPAPYGSHAEAGMTATLTVTAPS